MYDQRMLTALPTYLDGLSSESGPERLFGYRCLHAEYPD
jgi:hypothetical protein